MTTSYIVVTDNQDNIIDAKIKITVKKVKAYTGVEN